MGNIPSHLQHWDDWRPSLQQRPGHALFSFLIGVAGGIAVFSAPVIRIWIR